MVYTVQGEEQLGMEDGQPEAPPGLESLDPIYLYGGDKQLAASGVGEFMLGKVSSKKTSRKGKRARKRVLEEADLEGNAGVFSMSCRDNLFCIV